MDEREPLSVRVWRLLKDVLYDEHCFQGDKPPDGAIVVEGPMNTYAFNPERLERARAGIVEVIAEVVDDHFFHSDGCSVLLLMYDKNHEEWADEAIVRGMVAMAIGLGLAEFIGTREKWPSMPGGLPYVLFHPLPGTQTSTWAHMPPCPHV